METNKEKLISVCLPAYNGAAKIAATLDSIIAAIQEVPGHEDSLELAITDDGSTDETAAIAREYAARHVFVKFFQNEHNLGMDRNFRQAALNGRGRYVWFSGQDDIFLPGSVARVATALQKHPAVKMASVNFSQYDEKSGECLASSMLTRQAKHPETVAGDRDLVFTDAADYFKSFNDAPTFLPATVMVREWWLNTDASAYYGLCYIQYATILLNLKDSPILVITPPLIRGNIPAAGWQQDGDKLFSIQLGALKAAVMVANDTRNPFPLDIIRAKKHDYLYHFPRLAWAASYYGFRPSAQNKADLKFIYGTATYAFYLAPLLALAVATPKPLLRSLFAWHNRK